MSRHRLIRRGIAYGAYLPEAVGDKADEEPQREAAPRGIMFLRSTPASTSSSSCSTRGSAAATIFSRATTWTRWSEAATNAR